MSVATKRPLGAIVLVALLAAMIVAALLVPGLRDALSQDSLLALVDRAGPAAPLLFVAAMTVAVVISPIPNVPITAVIGMVYGPWVGTAIASGGALAGALAAFGIARRFGRKAIAAVARREVRFCAGCSNGTLSAIVFAARLIPVVSFDLVSYGAGLSQMSVWRFALWSYVGMLPWTWAFTAFGATLFDAPVLASVLGIVLGVAVLGLPAFVRRYNPFGLRRIMYESQDREEA